MVQCPACGGSFTPRAGASPIVCPYCQANLDEAETRPRALGSGLDSLDQATGFSQDELTQVEDQTRVDRPQSATTPAEEAPKETMFGSPNPFAHDSIAEGLPPKKAEPPPQEEKRTLFGRAAPQLPSAPKPAPPPRSADADESERRREERERYAAARLAAAAAVQKRRATTQRIRLALILIIVLGVAALIVAGVVLLTRDDFSAEIVGEPSVVRAQDAYQVKVRVRAAEPATVTHPGGQTPVDKAGADIAFSVPEVGLAVGDNDIPLTVSAPEQKPVELKLSVTVYYRLTSAAQAAPQEGRHVTAKLQLSPGWTAEVRGGEVVPEAPDTYLIKVDPEPLLDRVDDLKTPTGQLPVALTLRGPEGKVQAFTEQLELPLPTTPLTVWSPPPGRKTTADSITVAGRTSPGATVSAGGGYGRANGAGLFEVTAPLPAPGARTITVRADGRRRAPSETTLSVERLESGAWKAAARALERDAKDWLGRARRAPRWKDLVRKAERLRGNKVRLNGTLIAARRSASGGVEAQIDMCRGKARCPVWINLRDTPILSSAGERVTAYGALDGTREYTTAAGDAMTVPVLDGHALVP